MGRSKKKFRNERITGYVPPWVKRKIEGIIEKGDYTSESDMVTQALIDFVRGWEAV